MPKLKKKDFNETFRFRESRKGQVNCNTCPDMTSKSDNGKDAFCTHEERVRRVKLTDYLGPFTNKSAASTSVLISSLFCSKSFLS